MFGSSRFILYFCSVKTIAVILAGGTGSRMGKDLPKQFIAVNERCIIEYAIDAFEQNDSIDEICAVVHPAWIEHMKYIVSCNEWEKFTKIVVGGDERYMSSLHAIQAYENEPEDSLILFHDAARPLVSQELISGVVDALKDCRAAGVAVSCTDTIWHMKDGMINDIPERRSLMRAQTPQGFQLGVLREAYQNAISEGNIDVTDDCGIVKKYLPEVHIHVIEGDERNIKVTYPSDLDILKQKFK